MQRFLINARTSKLIATQVARRNCQPTYHATKSRISRHCHNRYERTNRGPLIAVISETRKTTGNVPSQDDCYFKQVFRVTGIFVATPVTRNAALGNST